MKSGFILLDKPGGVTSRQAAFRVAKMFGSEDSGARTFGHIGTLDPMASGIIVIALGEATKMIPYLELAASAKTGAACGKEYLFAVEWGVQTDTGDITGNVNVLERGGKIPTEDEIVKIIPKFIGEMDQIPPVFSAKKIKGVPAYKLARAGKIEYAILGLKPKRISIFDLSFNEGVFKVGCGAGTYIRALTSDIAKALGTVATCSMIRRTKSNGFDIENAVPLDFLENMYNNGGAVEKYLLPLDLGLDDIPVAKLETKDALKFSNGGFVPLKMEDGLVRVYERKFIGIGKVESGVLKPKRIVNVD
ncbi:MAG: tRNA pseudouridine(55) synthase TruB [Rickettsiales bacterium]|jgi:tRNA pseudouridine55 synthase|nr:tRNA pseudouridine(55) synthase TruB [Rickettsiales bacterium]